MCVCAHLRYACVQTNSQTYERNPEIFSFLLEARFIYFMTISPVHWVLRAILTILSNFFRMQFSFLPQNTEIKLEILHLYVNTSN